MLNEDRKGRAPKVKDRWYGRHEYRHTRDFSPRVLKVEPPFTFDQLYISPMTVRRCYGDNGKARYEPVERNLQPTGFVIMDDYLNMLASGRLDLSSFCARYGIRLNDLDSLIFIFTGMRGIDFRFAFQLRMADELLRFTDMPVAEVARRCGYGSRVNFYFALQRDLRTSPTARRMQLREEGDVGRYKLE